MLGLYYLVNCSMSDKSGECEGRGRMVILFACKNVVIIHAV